MTKSQRESLISNLKILLIHLLKYKFQSEKRTNSWLSTIKEHRKRLNKALKKSPSIKNYLEKILTNSYTKARKKASLETKLPVDIFPIQCPFTLENILNPDYLL